MLFNMEEIIDEKAGFKIEEIEACKKGKKLLGLGLELTRECNLHCIYCYSDSGRALPNELGLDELKCVIDEATSLGVKRIGIIGGGEPLRYKYLSDLINFVDKRKIKISLFTNGTLINTDWAKYFYLNNISLVHKLNSFDEIIQDKICKKKGTFKAISRALNLLFEIGYPDQLHKLTIETVVLKDNINEIPYIWRWARNRHIIPMVERVTPMGRAAGLSNICSASEIKELYEKLSKIDAEEYQNNWEPRPPIAGDVGCRHNLYSLYITSDGNIQPCSGVSISLGNVRRNSLRSVLKSKAILDLRHIRNKIKGKCNKCNLSEICYGCRGAAFHYYGDYLAEDPFCWKL